MPKLKIKAVNKKGQTYLSTDIALLIDYLKREYRNQWGKQYLTQMFYRMKEKNVPITYKSWTFTKIDESYIPQSGDKILTKQVTVIVTEVD